MTHLLSSLTYAPLAGALAVALVPGRHTQAIRVIAAVAATAAAILSLIVWFGFQPRGVEWQFVETLLHWTSIGASYAVGVDGLGLTFVVMTTIASWIAVIGSWTSIRERVKEGYATLLMLETATLVVFTSLDLLVWCAFWLVALGLTWRLTRVHPMVMVLTSIASVAVVAGVLSLYMSVHSLASVYTFDVRMLQHVTLVPTVQRAIFLTFALGFAIVAGLFPFHVWQRDAQVDSPSVVSFVVAVVVAKLGTYGFLRVSLPMLPDGTRFFATAMVGLSIVTILFGTLATYRQNDWKRIAIYVNVAVVGVMTLGTFYLTPAALMVSSAVQMTHALTVGALLVTADIARADGRTYSFRPLLRPFVAIAAVLFASVIAVAAQPRLKPTIETSIARIILRVSPERASEVSDCLTNPQAPPPADPALPAGFSAMAPCTDEKSPVPK